MKVAIVIYDKFDLENFAKFNDFFINTMKFQTKIYALKESILDKNGVCINLENHSQGLYDNDILVICDGNNEYIKYDQIFLSWISSGLKSKYKICCKSGSEIFKSTKFEDFSLIDENNFKEELLRLF